MLNHTTEGSKGSTEKRWQISPHIPEEADRDLIAYPPVVRQILFNRGITDADSATQFLNAQNGSLNDPFLLTGMAVAVERIWQAIEQHEPVVIYGDYDVDGVTASVLLVELLQIYGAQAKPYIPNRFDEGYGLNNEALYSLHNSGVRLVITVDCGARSPREADFARSLGLDLIISDHHHPGIELPDVIALINQKQAGDRYPFKELVGVGLAYKVAEALLNEHPLPGIQAAGWLDLVALGTVADLAPLLGENRTLVAAGIQQIRARTRQGIASLAATARMNIAHTNATDIGFLLAPRLNAAGRLESAIDAFNLLITQDASLTGKLAQDLDVQNSERQRITKEVQKQAAAIAIKENPDTALLFAADVRFNEGVLGLAASRLVEMFYRPAIVAHLGSEYTRGSCRSIPEFHITEALDQCADLLVRHGGHKAAAGFTVHNSNLATLVNRLQSIASQALDGMDLHQTIKAECELPLELLTIDYELEIFHYLDRLQPTGMSNPEPAFFARNLSVRSVQAVGKDAGHLRFSMIDSLGVLHDAIAFRQGQWATHMPAKIDLIYTLEKDDYFYPPRTKLNVKDLRPASSPVVNRQSGT
jgi:single-stranded-DNA-specific exonuclease